MSNGETKIKISNSEYGLLALRSIMEENRNKLAEDARTLAAEIMLETRSLDAKEVHLLWITSKAATIKDKEDWKEGVEALKIIEKEHPNFFPELVKVKDYERTWSGFGESLRWNKWLTIGTIIIAITSLITTIHLCSQTKEKTGVMMEEPVRNH